MGCTVRKLTTEERAPGGQLGVKMRKRRTTSLRRVRTKEKKELNAALDLGGRGTWKRTTEGAGQRRPDPNRQKACRQNDC